MKVQMDVNSYAASFTGGAKQYNFYVNMIFPGWGNAAKATIQQAMAGGFDSLNTENLIETGLTAGSSALSVLNTHGGMKGIEFYVRSSSLPESTFEEITTGWMGHEYKMAGKQTFNDWSVTYNVDKNGLLLRKFYNWQKIIHDSELNTYGKPVIYMTDPEVHLLGYDSGETVCVYKLYGAWPKTIGQVQLDYGNNDIATVDITFAYQYHTVTESEPGALSQIMKRGVRSFFQMGGLESAGKLFNIK